MIRFIDEFIEEIANLFELILYVIGGLLLIMAFLYLVAWILGSLSQFI